MTEARHARKGAAGRERRSRLRGLSRVALEIALLGLTAWLVVLFECKISG